MPPTALTVTVSYRLGLGCTLQGRQYILTPRMDKFVCRLAGSDASESVPPTARRLHATAEDRRGTRSPVPKQYGGLPTLDGFQFDSAIEFEGKAAEKWTYTHTVRFFAPTIRTLSARSAEQCSVDLLWPALVAFSTSGHASSQVLVGA